MDFLGVNYQTAEELLDAVITLEQNSETNSTYQHPGFRLLPYDLTKISNVFYRR